MVRSILFPPPLDFKFHSDFVKSIYVFLTLGLIGMAYSVYMWTKKGVSINVDSAVCTSLCHNVIAMDRKSNICHSAFREP